MSRAAHFPPVIAGQHTLGHISCPACEAAKHAAMRAEDFAEMTFAAAFPVWLESPYRPIHEQL